MIPIFQNHIFEKKIRKNVETPPRDRSQTNAKVKNEPVHLGLQLAKSTADVESNFLTPNRTNFNFKQASPFLVNINCYRPKYKKKSIQPERIETKDSEEIIEISDSDDNSDVKVRPVVRNLFELTQENIEKHLSMTVKKNRKNSLIDLWRKKVNDSRQRKSMLSISECGFESSNHACEMSDKIESQSTESSHQSVDTVVPANQKDKPHESEADDSFFTAADQKSEEHAQLNNKSETIVQTQEIYEHFDAENNIMFYENKLSTKTHNTPSNTECEIVELNTSSESGTCTDLATPSDYDTDNLRQELKAFGDKPGPITKSTKRLYLKRLVRYKRHPQRYEKTNTNERVKCEKQLIQLQSLYLT